MPSKTPRPLPSIDLLRARFSYDPETGVLLNRRSGEVAGKPIGAKSPYRTVCVCGERYLLHRVCFALATGTDPQHFVIDHINRNPTDNRASNLRAVSWADNNRNRNGRYRVGPKGILDLAVGQERSFGVERLLSLRAYASRLKKNGGPNFVVQRCSDQVTVVRLS